MLPELVNYGRLYREGVTATSEFLRLVGALNHQITVRFAGAGTGMSEAEAVPESGTKRPGRWWRQWWQTSIGQEGALLPPLLRWMERGYFK